MSIIVYLHVGGGCTPHDLHEDTERWKPVELVCVCETVVALPTICTRILKGSSMMRSHLASSCCTPHDLHEDTERGDGRVAGDPGSPVALPTICTRILKD